MKNNNIYIGIGSNLRGHMSSSKNIMNQVLFYLSRYGLKIVDKSNIYRSRPVPSGLGPCYYNRVVLVESCASAQKILYRLKHIEAIYGRKNIKYRNFPRILDLDLLDYKQEIINSSKLTLPHPRIIDRDFVLKPLYELNPNWKHPKIDKNIKSLLVKNNRYSINMAGLVKIYGL